MRWNGALSSNPYICLAFGLTRWHMEGYQEKHCFCIQTSTLWFRWEKLFVWNFEEYLSRLDHSCLFSLFQNFIIFIVGSTHTSILTSPSALPSRRVFILKPVAWLSSVSNALLRHFSCALPTLSRVTATLFDHIKRTPRTSMLGVIYIKWLNLSRIFVTVKIFLHDYINSYR